MCGQLIPLASRFDTMHIAFNIRARTAKKERVVRVRELRQICCRFFSSGFEAEASNVLRPRQ